MIESFKNPINNIINPERSMEDHLSEKSIRPTSINELGVVISERSNNNFSLSSLDAYTNQGMCNIWADCFSITYVD